MKALTFLFLTVLSVATSGCFEYNPNQITLDDDEKNLTAKNLAELQNVSPPDTLRFAFMGDTQRFYDASADFVKSVNKIPNLSFVMHGGDISDFGLQQEYKWINDIMSGIYVPYLTVIGNHDLLANGQKVYEQMYGALNYTFEYGNYRFIVLNTNSRENDFDGTVPDLGWLRQELGNNPGNKNTIVISHVPPYDSDFDKNLEKEYTTLLSEDPNVNLSLHAHRSSFSDEEYYDDGVRYFVTTSMEKRGYVLVKLWKDGMGLQIIDY